MTIINAFYDTFTKQLCTDISDLIASEDNPLTLPIKTIAFDFGSGGWFSHKLIDFPRYITSSMKLIAHELIHEWASIHTGTYSDGIIEIDSKEMGMIGRLLDEDSLNLIHEDKNYPVRIITTDLIEDRGFLGFAHFNYGTPYQNIVNYIAPLVVFGVIGPIIMTYAKRSRNYLNKAFWSGVGLYLSFEPTISYFTNDNIKETDIYKVTENALSIAGVNIKDEYSMILSGAIFVTTLLGNLLGYSIIRKASDYLIRSNDRQTK
ncbi:MAG: hypothetical protein NDI94_02420 [Candidatus Woesearchaeota archaeon]|nr:hypothetical protein [Candidatus Woesearchaeota archaeon]